LNKMPIIIVPNPNYLDTESDRPEDLQYNQELREPATEEPVAPTTSVSSYDQITPDPQQQASERQARSAEEGQIRMAAMNLQHQRALYGNDPRIMSQAEMDELGLLPVVPELNLPLHEITQNQANNAGITEKNPRSLKLQGDGSLSQQVEFPENLIRDHPDVSTGNVNDAFSKLGIWANRPTLIMESNYVPIGDPFRKALWKGQINSWQWVRNPNGSGGSYTSISADPSVEDIELNILYSLAQLEKIEEYFRALRKNNLDLYIALLKDKGLKGNNFKKAIEFINELQNFKTGVFKEKLNIDRLIAYGYRQSMSETKLIVQIFADLGSYYSYGPLDIGFPDIYENLDPALNTDTLSTPPPFRDLSKAVIGGVETDIDNNYEQYSLGLFSSMLYPALDNNTPIETHTISNVGYFADPTCGVVGLMGHTRAGSWQAMKGYEDDVNAGISGHHLVNEEIAQSVLHGKQYHHPADSLDGVPGCYEVAAGFYRYWMRGAESIENRSGESWSPQDQTAGLNYLTALMNNLWSDLCMSYLEVKSNDISITSNIGIIKDSKNVLADFIGAAGEPGGLAADNESIGLMKLIKYPSMGTKVLPFEESGKIPHGNNRETYLSGMEAWVEPNIAHIIEDNGSEDFDPIKKYLREWDSAIAYIEKRIGPFITGGARVILNAVLLELKKLSELDSYTDVAPMSHTSAYWNGSGRFADYKDGGNFSPANDGYVTLSSYHEDLQTQQDWARSSSCFPKYHIFLMFVKIMTLSGGHRKGFLKMTMDWGAMSTGQHALGSNPTDATVEGSGFHHLADFIWLNSMVTMPTVGGDESSATSVTRGSSPQYWNYGDGQSTPDRPPGITSSTSFGFSHKKAGYSNPSYMNFPQYDPNTWTSCYASGFLAQCWSGPDLDWKYDLETNEIGGRDWWDTAGHIGWSTTSYTANTLYAAGSTGLAGGGSAAALQSDIYSAGVSGHWWPHGRRAVEWSTMNIQSNAVTNLSETAWRPPKAGNRYVRTAVRYFWWSVSGVLAEFFKNVENNIYDSVVRNLFNHNLVNENSSEMSKKEIFETMYYANVGIAGDSDEVEQQSDYYVIGQDSNAIKSVMLESSINPGEASWDPGEWESKAAQDSGTTVGVNTSTRTGINTNGMDLRVRTRHGNINHMLIRQSLIEITHMVCNQFMEEGCTTGDQDGNMNIDLKIWAPIHMMGGANISTFNLYASFTVAGLYNITEPLGTHSSSADKRSSFQKYNHEAMLMGQIKALQSMATDNTEIKPYPQPLKFKIVDSAIEDWIKLSTGGNTTQANAFWQDSAFVSELSAHFSSIGSSYYDILDESVNNWTDYADANSNATSDCPITFRMPSESMAFMQAGVGYPSGYLNRAFMTKWNSILCQYERAPRLFKSKIHNMNDTWKTIADKLESIKEIPDFKAVREVAKLPGINFSDISRYSDFRQQALRTVIHDKILKESTDYGTSFIPSLYSTSSPGLKKSLMYLFQKIEKDVKFGDGNLAIMSVGQVLSNLEFGGELSETVLYTIGIPTGLIDNPDVNTTAGIKPENKIIQINHYFDPIFFNRHPIPKSHYFDPLLFVTEDSFRSITDVGDALENIDTFVNEATYYYYDTGVNNSMGSITEYSYTEALNVVQSKISNTIMAETSVNDEGAFRTVEEEARQILTNHIIDACIKAYYKYTNGMIISEVGFPIDLEAGENFISQIAIDEKDSLLDPKVLKDCNLSFDGSIYDTIVNKGNRSIIDYSEFRKTMKLDEITENVIYTDFNAWSQSRLIGAESTLVDSISSKVFDRVFCVYWNVSMAVFSADEYASMTSWEKQKVTPYIRTNTNGDDIVQFRITMDTAQALATNQLHNDNVSVNFFTVSVVGSSS